MKDDAARIMKGLYEAECLLNDLVPARYRGNALAAVMDAMERIKPVPVEMDGGGGEWFPVCGECHTVLARKYSYCPECGRGIVW